MKILAVCGMGFGSSMMLKMTAEKVLKEKGVKADVETTDFSTASSADADLILTNEEFARQLEGGKTKVIAIKNISDANEVEEALSEVL
ncbi:PTS sugar transporter subunit IIB [Alkalibacillus aidingensis]|uniref:PTS sugar transporter subunit IIB n=1 Tax=Alkalibacillus aidingensis TaxID=2747607 RepID=UPI0016613270|nr:PTS sugar transporter subunit IIB [Alkalibacillus aidingensis]